MTTKKDNLSILYFIGFWVLYLFAHQALKNSVSYAKFDGILNFGLSTILIAVAITYAIQLYINSSGKTKKIFGYLSIAYVSVFIINAVYQIAYNILHISHDSTPPLLSFCINIPYISFLFFHFLALAISIPVKTQQKSFRRFFLYIPTAIIITTLCIVLFLTVANNQIKLASIYDYIEIILQFSGLVIAIICIALSKNKAIFYLALSFVIIVSSDLIMNLSILSQNYGSSSTIESLWFIGVLFRIYSLRYFKYSLENKNETEAWIYS